MSNLLTMIMVLGGTFVAGAALLYLSLMTGRQRPPRQGRGRALETTAVMAATQDANADSSPRSD